MLTFLSFLFIFCAAGSLMAVAMALASGGTCPTPIRKDSTEDAERATEAAHGQ